jgi:hypothetical protein
VNGKSLKQKLYDYRRKNGEKRYQELLRKIEVQEKLAEK